MKTRAIAAYVPPPPPPEDEGAWYTPAQLRAYRDWLRARPSPFWRVRGAPRQGPEGDPPGEREGALDAVQFEEDDYVLIDENDPEA